MTEPQFTLDSKTTYVVEWAARKRYPSDFSSRHRAEMNDLSDAVHLSVKDPGCDSTNIIFSHIDDLIAALTQLRDRKNKVTK